MEDTNINNILEKGTLLHCCGNVTGTTTMENNMEVPQKTKIELLYDPAIPLLGIYPEKILIWKDTCTPMFISLFTIAKTWKQTKGQNIFNEILLNHKKERMPFGAVWMDLKIIILSEGSQTEKTNIIWYHLYVECKIWYKWNYLQNQNRLTENKLTVTTGKGGKG